MKVDLKKAFSKKKLAAVLFLLAVIFVMVLSNPEITEFFSDSEAAELNFRVGVGYQMLPYGKDMLLVNNEGITAFDKSGREVWNVVAATNSPTAQVKDDYIMLAEMNGKTVKTFKKENIATQIQTENEILCAKLNRNGYVAVATNELGYKGLVTVYDKNGDGIYKWHSGTGYIGDMDISPQNTVAVIQLVTSKEKLCSKIVIVNPKSDDDPEVIAELEGMAMKVRYCDNGSLIVVSEKGIYGFKKSGKQSFFTDFEGRTPLTCNIENEKNMVFAFDSGMNNTVLEAYSASGELRGTYSADSEIKALDVSGECILAVEADRVVMLNPKGTIKNETEKVSDIKAIRFFSGRDRYMVLGGSSAEIIKIK